MGDRRRRRPNGRRVTHVRWRIRPVQAADAAAIHAIERTAFSDPWSERDVRDAIASGVPFLVAADADGLAGYVIAHHGADEGEILNLGVAPRSRRRGIGRALVREMLALLATHGVRAVFLEVRESNHAARELYQSLGFSAVGLRSNYYRRPTESAVVLRTAIPAVGGDA